jgi:hypothetical protein
MSPGRISCKLNLDHIADHCLYANISRDTAGTIAYAMEEPLAFDLLWLPSTVHFVHCLPGRTHAQLDDASGQGFVRRRISELLEIQDLPLKSW